VEPGLDPNLVGRPQDPVPLYNITFMLPHKKWFALHEVVQTVHNYDIAKFLHNGYPCHSFA